MTAAGSYEPGHYMLGIAGAPGEIDPVSESYLILQERITERVHLHEALGHCSRAVVETGQQFNDFILQTMNGQGEHVQRRREQLRDEVAVANKAYHDCIARTVQLDEELTWLPAPLDYSEDRAQQFGLNGLLLRQDEVRQWGTPREGTQYIRRERGQVDVRALGQMLTDTVLAHSAFGNQQSLQASEAAYELREHGRDLWSEVPAETPDTQATLTDGNVISLQQ